MAGGPGKPKSANPQVLFDKALAAYQAGDEAKAQRLAKKLTKAAPHVADAWQLKAIISLNAGKADAAVHCPHAAPLSAHRAVHCHGICPLASRQYPLAPSAPDSCASHVVRSESTLT